mgnify:CR=1 FL=1
MRFWWRPPQFVVQKGVNDLAGEAGAHNAAAQAQGIGVVVAAGVLGAERLRAAAGADALDLVGTHRHAHTRAAAQDGEIAAAIGHSAAGGGGIIGIVTAGGAVGAKVAVSNAALFQMLFDGLFQLITAVVSTQAIGFSNCTAIIKILSIRGGLLGASRSARSRSAWLKR